MGTPKDPFAVLDRRVYPTGRVIFQKDDLGSSALYLKRGTVEIFKNDGTRDIPIATLSPGEIFGEMALLGSGRRSTSARATSECECVFISGSDMDRLMGNAEPGVKALLRVLVRRLQDLNEKIEECPETGRFRIKADAA
jgi:CRP/FNR family transcriptional regulator, cyclic AMP receptor protein